MFGQPSFTCTSEIGPEILRFTSSMCVPPTYNAVVAQLQTAWFSGHPLMDFQLDAAGGIRRGRLLGDSGSKCHRKHTLRRRLSSMSEIECLEHIA